MALTTVNTNPAICREMWVLLQNDGGARTLQWAREKLFAKMAYQVHNKQRISTVYLTYPLGGTFNTLNRNLYVIFVPFLIHHLHISLRIAATLRCIIRWWNISNTGTAKKGFVTTIVHVALRTLLVLLEELEVPSCYMHWQTKMNINFLNKLSYYYT